MASTKVKIPPIRTSSTKPVIDLNQNQNDLLDKAGKAFEKFLRDAREQNERAAEINVRLHALGLDDITTREQFRDEVRRANPNTEAGMKRLVELLALAKDFASLTPPIEEVPGPDLHAESAAVDSSPTKEEDRIMSATTDKDYIDAKLLAATTQMIGDIKAANATMDGRLALIEARTDARIASIESKMDANFARFDATLHKSTADTVKWVAGTVLALGVIGISVMTFLLNNVAPKAAAPAPAPVVIYAQPAPAASVVPLAPAAKP